jgi:hypothetical protein
MMLQHIWNTTIFISAFIRNLETSIPEITLCKVNLSVIFNIIADKGFNNVFVKMNIALTPQ